MGGPVPDVPPLASPSAAGLQLPARLSWPPDGGMGKWQPEGDEAAKSGGTRRRRRRHGQAVRARVNRRRWRSAQGSTAGVGDESRGARGSRPPRRCKSSAAEREGGRGGRRGRISERIFGDLDDRGGRKRQGRGLVLVVGDDDVIP
jgi:hypothetical protein